MKKYIGYLLLACFIIGFTLLAGGKVFSQSSQNENKTDTTISAKTMPAGSSAYVSGITAGRAKALAGVVVALTSLVIGWRAKVVYSRGKGNIRTGAMVALLLGLISIGLSIMHLMTSAGAVFGSGSGKAGAIFALVPALIGITLGGLALRQKKI